MLKRIERWGRLWLTKALALALRSPKKKLDLPQAPKILIIRLDQRVGNLIMLTPILSSLKEHFGKCHLTLVAQPAAQTILMNHPDLDELLIFRKKALWGQDGPFKTILKIRREKFDVVIDGGNPTDPSTTQSILTRFSGGKHTLGFAHGPFAELYTCPHKLDPNLHHEIDMRLDLLQAIPKMKLLRKTSLGHLAPNISNENLDPILSAMRREKHLLINCGARLSEKSLNAQSYAQIAKIALERNFRVLLTYGPSESGLAQAITNIEKDCLLAPETTLPELALLMQHAAAIVACDTGPMHIGVAMNTPTTGIFLTTSPKRYGYTDGMHQVLDMNSESIVDSLTAIEHWLTELSV